MLGAFYKVASVVRTFKALTAVEGILMLFPTLTGAVRVSLLHRKLRQARFRDSLYTRCTRGTERLKGDNIYNSE